jgi:putative heme-binding domain-containing protein
MDRRFCSLFPLYLIPFAALLVAPVTKIGAQPNQADPLASYRQAALRGGDPVRGKGVFDSKEASCLKCHTLEGTERRAGPDLRSISDKYGREQLIQAVLEPNATIHPDYGTILVATVAGKVHAGVLYKRSRTELQLLDVEGKRVEIPVAQIETEKRSGTSLMPIGLQKQVSEQQFADLIAYLETQRQPEGELQFVGMPSEIPMIDRPVPLVELHHKTDRFDHPVWVIAVPGTPNVFLVVEQKSRKIWRYAGLANGDRKELFADFSSEATTGEFEGVVCLAFHPRFLENRKYYVNYHVRNQGSFFSPVIVERQASADFRRDAGIPSRRLLQIPQDTDLHWGGMLAFGPDGYLYIGAGDAGPQEDPEGHSQDLSLLSGSILRIDVDHQKEGLPYAIPETNPYRHAPAPVRSEIWASGYRMPWRFSFDPITQDLWVGDIGQNLFEEISIARVGENHGWNVYEGFMPFSEQYRRDGEQYTPPVFSYRRKYGVSVTGGYVYRGKRNPSFYGAYIFGDFESKRIFALTQSDRQLIKVRQIGESPQRIASFGLDHDGEILVVGYEGTIFRLNLDNSEFGVDLPKKTRLSLLRQDRPAAARVTLTGSDGKHHVPLGAVTRKTHRNESYFYADGSFGVSLPAGASVLSVSGGIETIPQTITIDGTTISELTVPLQCWIDLSSRGWYSGDSHVHLHTGGPHQVGMADALLAARAEGVHYVNLCVSNNVGDDIRDATLISGKPHPASTDRHLLVFGEEMRSTIYGHMQFLGIQKLVEPQYTGFDKTPNFHDFPANYLMAAEAVRQGGIVTYSHPLFAGQPYPFEDELTKPSGAARELPIDAVLGVVQAIDLMSYNSDEENSADLWYRLLNCGLKLSACVGTDALLDRSTEPLGGDRVYVRTIGPLTMENWLNGLKQGRSFVTNGPIPTLKVNTSDVGETCHLNEPGTVQVTATVESYVPFDRIEILVNGKVVSQDQLPESNTAEVRIHQREFKLEIDRSSWIALRVRGPDHPLVFDGPAWAHTSPVYVEVAGQKISSPEDAAYFVDWIEQLLRVVAARNRYATVEDRQEVEALFRKAQNEYRKLANP